MISTLAYMNWPGAVVCVASLIAACFLAALFIGPRPPYDEEPENDQD